MSARLSGWWTAASRRAPSCTRRTTRAPRDGRECPWRGALRAPPPRRAPDRARAPGRGRGAQGSEHLVHGVLEAIEVGEGRDVVSGELVLGSAGRREHGGQRAGERGGQHLGHEGEAVALVRALLPRAAERRLEEIVPIE